MDIESIAEDSQWMTENVRRYWLFDKRVVVYEVKGFTRKITDEWYNTVSSTLEDWPPEGQQMIAIHDLRAASLTPYTRHKSKQLASENSHLCGHSIIIIPDTIFGNFIRIFLNTVLARTQPDIVRYICTSMDDAVAYLKQQLQV